MAARSVPSPRYDWREDYRLNTLDIVVAVLLGIIEAVIEIFGALGFLERTVWAAGAAGFAFYAFYNGTTWILFFAGAQLRKRAGVILLGAVVTHMIRWFAGDPDGPILMWYALCPAVAGVVAFHLLRWRGGNLLFALAAAVTATFNQIALYVVLRGFDQAEGALWGVVSLLVAFGGGLIWGVLGRYLGIGLARAGVPEVEEPPARGGAEVHA
jgi:ABC-type thiamin/hydroxymethylpyrimidine transport system permease subunit